MVSAIRPLTEEYLMELEHRGQHFEVRHGNLTEAEVAGENHGWVEFKLLLLIGREVDERKLGRMYPGDVDFVLDGEPGNIRIKYQPDVGFLKAENVMPSPGFIYRAPDLAIEIISPSQSYQQIRDKVDDYLLYGTEQVWIVIPTSKRIEVILSDNSSRIYREGDTITVGDLISGLVIEVSKVFEA